MDSKLFLSEPYRLYDRQVGIPFTAARASRFTNLLKRPCCHLIGQSPFFFCQRSGFCNNRQIHPRTDPCSAGSPKTTGSSGNLFSAVVHLRQSLPKLHLSPCIMIGSKKRSSDHYMMLRSMHMAKRHRHHFVNYLNRIFAVFMQTQPDYTVHPLSMTLTAHIMPLNTACFTAFFFMADRTFHQNILLQIF